MGKFWWGKIWRIVSYSPKLFPANIHIFPASIHRYTKNVFGIYALTVADSPIANSFHLYGPCQIFPVYTLLVKCYALFLCDVLLSHSSAGNESCPQPQTSEHLAAIEIMRLRHIIILQNKIDIIKESQAQEQYQDIVRFVQGQ